MSDIQIFNYNGNGVTFRKGDYVMVSATEMAKPFGKLAKDWLSNKSTNEFIHTLSAVRGIVLTDLVVVKQGGNGEQGTWMHEDVALEFARWLSPAFAIWCNDRIKELMQVGFTATPATLEAMIANPDLVIGMATQLKQLRAENEEKQKLISARDKTIGKLQPLADFAKTAFTSDTLVSISQAAKILKLPFGRNTLFRKLRESGIFFKSKNEPKQKYCDADYFRVVERSPIETSDELMIPITVYCTQKGLAFINLKFGNRQNNVPQLAKIV